MKREQLDTIKELAALRVEEILDTLGINYSPRYNYYVAACPVHGGSRRDAWSWHIDKQMWRCFSHQCEKDYGQDIIGLIMGVRECSFMDALDFTKGFVDSNISKEEIKKLLDQKKNREFIEASREEKSDKIYDPSCLERLSYHGYLEGRGFPRWLVEQYQIGACLEPHKYMSGRVVVPVCDINGGIVGFTGRTLDEDWEAKSIPKWRHSKGSWASRNLFNINNAAPHIQNTGVVIVVEGPFDVLRLEEAGIRNAVSILGKTLHSGQMTLLYKAGAFAILDALDNDAAGQIGSQNLKKKASCMFDVKKLKLPDSYKDFGDMTVNVINDYFATLEVAIGIR